jgi:NADH dehydrogenase
MHVTIVGGGFGGVKAALELAKDRNNTVTLISDKPDFQYYPTLYSSATGHSHLESWAPLGEIFADFQNIYVYIDTIDNIDAKAKKLHGTSGTEYHYETVIFAMGVVTTYFGIPGLDTYTYGIKSEQEIKRL